VFCPLLQADELVAQMPPIGRGKGKNRALQGSEAALDAVQQQSPRVVGGSLLGFH
jgi:hypothetical protein